MGFSKPKKQVEIPDHFFYFSEGARQPFKRDWLEENAAKSTRQRLQMCVMVNV